MRPGPQKITGKLHHKNIRIDVSETGNYFSLDVTNETVRPLEMN